MFEIELRRVFSKKFYLCLIIGTIIVVMDFVDRAPYLLNNIAYIKEQIQKGIFVFELPCSAYALWIGTNMSKMHTLYRRIMPLLIAVPYGGSLCFDRKGYQNHLLTRSSRKKYYASKYGAQFLGSGIMAVFPLLVQLVMCAVCMPFSQPLSYTFYYPVWDNTFLSDIFYSERHLMYIVVYLGLNFIGYGLLGTLCFVITLWERNKYVCIAGPILFTYIVHSTGLFFSPVKAASFFYYLVMFNIEQSQIWIVILSWVIISAFIISAFFIDTNRGE